MLQKPKAPSAANRSMSHGRGGAGNMGSGPNDVDAKDLETPTIKTQNYTTGRGGAHYLYLDWRSRYAMILML